MSADSVSGLAQAPVQPTPPPAQGAGSAAPATQPVAGTGIGAGTGAATASTSPASLPAGRLSAKPVEFGEINKAYDDLQALPSYAPQADKLAAERKLEIAVTEQLKVGCRIEAGLYNPADLQRRAEAVAQRVADSFPDEKASTLRSYIRAAQGTLAYSNIQQISKAPLHLDDPWARASINYVASLLLEQRITDDPTVEVSGSHFDRLLYFVTFALMQRLDDRVVAAVVKACKERLNVVVTYDKASGETHPSMTRIAVLKSMVVSTHDAAAVEVIAQYEQAAQEAIDNVSGTSGLRP